MPPRPIGSCSTSTIGGCRRCGRRRRATRHSFAGPPSDAGIPANGTLREQQVQAGVVFPIRRVASAQTLIASVVRSLDDFTFPDHVVLSLIGTAARAGWSASNAITYGYSISPEGGVDGWRDAEIVPTRLGSSADATAVAADGARLPAGPGGASRAGPARWPAGVRAATAISSASSISAAARAISSALDFGREADQPAPRLSADTFAGTRVALMNADYRWPIARPQRGIGPWPVFLHTIHAAVFADAGHAWTRSFDANDVKTSAGAELSIDIVAGYALPFTAVVGVGMGTRRQPHGRRSRDGVLPTGARVLDSAVSSQLPSSSVGRRSHQPRATRIMSRAPSDRFEDLNEPAV